MKKHSASNLVRPRLLAPLAIAGAALLVLSSCLGGSGESGSSGGATEGRMINIGAGKPGKLTPGESRDSETSVIVDRVFSALTAYDQKSGELHNEVAESIKTDDNLNWTIKIKPDWKFTDGTPVTAKSFVDAWNYIANPGNAQKNQDSFDIIEGYSEKTPQAEMSGLKVVDDHTFTVKLNQKLNDFPDRMTDTSYYPLPEAAFKDMEAFAKAPFGNGPYIYENAIPEVSYDLRTNPDFKGRDKPKHPGFKVTIFIQGNAEWNEYLAGNIDYMEVPSSAASTYKTESEGRVHTWEGSVTALLDIPESLEGFENSPAGLLRRQAISLAINRKEVTEKIYNNLRYPVTGIMPKVYYPQLQGLKGADAVKFDPDEAKKKWAEAEKLSPLPAGEKIHFYYNGDGGHKEWVEAVSHQINNTLGIDLEPDGIPTFNEYLARKKAKTVQGFLRAGWIFGRIPSVNLELLFKTGGSANDSGFSNPEFDRLLSEAISTLSKDEETKLYREAVSIVQENLPTIPLWGTVRAFAWGKDMKVKTDCFIGSVCVYDLVKK